MIPDQHLCDTFRHFMRRQSATKILSNHSTLCFSKTERMHDLVIGLFINRYEFGRAI